MRSILEALARWHPPAGTVASVAVDARPASFLVTTRLRRPDGRIVEASRDIPAAGLGRLDVRGITNLFTESAVAAWNRPDAAPAPSPEADREPKPAEAPTAHEHRKPHRP